MRLASLDHIAFVVPDIQAACRQCESLGFEPGEVHEFAEEGTREQYLGPDGALGRVLLMQPIDEDGPYARALRQRGPGLHHLGLSVEELDRFLRHAVLGSGWLLHPRSFDTRRESNTIWLARPGVQALIEVHEGARTYDDVVAERVVIAGLQTGSRLARLFDDCGVEVIGGERSSVWAADAVFSAGD